MVKNFLDQEEDVMKKFDNLLQNPALSDEEARTLFIACVIYHRGDNAKVKSLAWSVMKYRPALAQKISGEIRARRGR